MADDKILEHIYIKGELELTSPLIVGSGEDENTDIDVVRDWDGNPFIPGTSLAGAFRHYLAENYEDGEKITKSIFGDRSKDSKLSLLLFSDATFESAPKVFSRDGVHLDYETRTVKTDDQFSKYDYEILEPGQNLMFKMEAVRRANNENSDTFNDVIFHLVDALKREKISVGAKTRRGFGKLKLVNEKILALDMTEPDDAQKWLNLDDDSIEWDTELSDFNKGIVQPKNNIQKIEASFKIPYSILIRHYSEEYKDVDTSHIASNGKFVIPGTSWNGAIRHAAHQILLDLNVNEDKAKELEEEIFGLAAKKEEESHASYLTIKESVIHDGKKLLTYTRNKVDRFTGGVVDAALFDEMPYYQGTVKLEIDLKIADKEQENWKIGLLKMAIQDIGKGIQPVGGDANIGRGILVFSSDFKVENDYCKALAKKIGGGKK